MITTEDVLRSLFSQLPKIEDKNGIGFDVKFNWGNQSDLNLFLSQLKKTVKYPLIWLVDGTDNITVIPNKIERRIKLFIAKQSIHKTNTNPIVWDSEFRDTLNPLLNNIITAFTKCDLTFIKDDSYSIKRDANYSGKDVISTTIDPWNVIIFECDLIIYPDKCMNKIKF
ncbi:MAG TPA: hypothetical protein VK462_01780 [Nitrososphaeraceae archaeon]|nr:hypothetical protein [Nitrososphaeraceae archaeon]